MCERDVYTEEAEKYRKIRVAELLKHTWCFEAVESDISIETFMERELVLYRLERITSGNMVSLQGTPPIEALTRAYSSEYGSELPFKARLSYIYIYITSPSPSPFLIHLAIIESGAFD